MELSKGGRRPVYLGHRSTVLIGAHAGQVYNDGGSGYVMNAAALSLLAERGLDNETTCPTIGDTTSAEDVNVVLGGGFALRRDCYATGTPQRPRPSPQALCLRRLGVEPVATSDTEGRERFHFHR